MSAVLDAGRVIAPGHSAKKELEITPKDLGVFELSYAASASPHGVVVGTNVA